MKLKLFSCVHMKLKLTPVSGVKMSHFPGSPRKNWFRNGNAQVTQSNLSMLTLWTFFRQILCFKSVTSFVILFWARNMCRPDGPEIGLSAAANFRFIHSTGKMNSANQLSMIGLLAFFVKSTTSILPTWSTICGTSGVTTVEITNATSGLGNGTPPNS